MGRNANRGQNRNPKPAKRKQKSQQSNTHWNGNLATIHPKTPGQDEYLKVLRTHDLVFGFGPAGTGKTFLAVYEAVVALEKGLVERIVLTRPAIEAGENLGFLPGDLDEKVAPYLHPLLSSLNKILPKGRVDMHRKRDKIEIVPLAYMRGRTMEDAFIILDEAQNCTFDQLMMFLTRIGEGSRCVLTGDASQTDIDGYSGFMSMYQAVQNVAGVGSHEMGIDDVVRHTLVADIIRAVESYRKNSHDFKVMGRKRAI